LLQTYKFPKASIRELERIELWKSGIHAWSWDNVCKRKIEWDCGLRRIEDHSSPAGIKPLWKLCTSTVYGATMRSNYLGGNSIWDVKIQVYWTLALWIFLMEIREHARLESMQEPTC